MMEYVRVRTKLLYVCRYESSLVHHLIMYALVSAWISSKYPCYNN